MNAMSKHATKRQAAGPAAWLVLGTMGLASVVFQVDHALGGGLPRWLIAGVVGFAPVAVSLGVAHMIARHRGGTSVRVAAILVMACGMTLSMGAIAWVVGPYYHSWLRWLFGLLLDGAALFAAWVLLSDHERKAQEASAVEAAEQAAAEATGQLAGLREELAAARAALADATVALETERARRVPARRPASSRGGIEAKRAKARELLKAGDLTQPEIAKAAGVSLSTVERIRRQIPPQLHPVREA